MAARQVRETRTENSRTERPAQAGIEPTNTMIKYACHSRLDEQRRED